MGLEPEPHALLNLDRIVDGVGVAPAVAQTGSVAAQLNESRRAVVLAGEIEAHRTPAATTIFAVALAQLVHTALQFLAPRLPRVQDPADRTGHGPTISP